MKEQEFYRLIDEVLELPEGTITGGETLTEIPKWDSIAVLGFIAAVDRKFNIILPGEKLFHCKTIQDLRDLVGEKYSDQ